MHARVYAHMYVLRVCAYPSYGCARVSVSVICMSHAGRASLHIEEYFTCFAVLKNSILCIGHTPNPMKRGGEEC